MELLTIDVYNDALKKASSKTKEEQYMLLEFSYDKRCVLPIKQAVAIIEALEGGYLYKGEYCSVPTLQPIEDEFRFRMFSEKELKDIKVAILLGVPLTEIKSIQKSK